MSLYKKLIQKFQVDVQSLAQTDGNKNGKIDTDSEKNKLAELLAGVKSEIEKLYSNEKGKLEKLGNTLSKNSYDKREVSIFSDYKNAINEISTMADSLVIKRPAFKINQDGSYETISEETESGVNVIVFDKDENEIARKVYTKSKKAVYSNKDLVAKYCGLNTKNENSLGPEPSQFKRFLVSHIPIVGSRLYDAEDNMRDAIGRLADDEALDFKSGIIYKWNSQTFEYEKVGRMDMFPDRHTFSATAYGEKIYEK